ncbi:arginyltransferase [Govanella unica]|uniref:Aspartate/glutamate leucyltransferase n=1 Tax=Govanella unica TaxID=2975056 RepID=A0A9X3TWT8_9PROT|nr:arginyltransferase [Govania unica]
MTDQSFNFPKFYVTTPGPCPYLPERMERKVFTELAGGNPLALNETLSQAGFRRSQSVAYRPACDGCNACTSVRLRAPDFNWTRSWRRIINRNSDLIATEVPPWATTEQYDLLKRYLDARHPEGGMTDMSIIDYAEMVETSPVETHLVEYRLARPGSLEAHGLQPPSGRLIGVALIDVMTDGLSMVYSFFDPLEPRRSLGSYLILDHVRRALGLCKNYVYLGYWVKGSRKMAYKASFSPLERLTPAGWIEFQP